MELKQFFVTKQSEGSSKGVFVESIKSEKAYDILQMTPDEIGKCIEDQNKNNATNFKTLSKEQ